MTLKQVFIGKKRRVVARDSDGHKITMLSGHYNTVKYKLLPAVNSVNPEVIDKTGNSRIARDIIRFCRLNEQPHKWNLDTAELSEEQLKKLFG